MIRILIDTNVILDVLLARPPHVVASVAVWSAIESGRAEGLVAAHAITTVHYLIRKELGVAAARRVLAALLRVFRIAIVDGAVIHEALASEFSDFEDAVTASAATLAGCDLIVTRDPKGYRGSAIRALAPEAATPLLAKTR